MSIYKSVDKLVQYGLFCGLIMEEDAVYARNRILERLGLDSYEYSENDTLFTEENKADILEEVLKELDDYAADKGLIDPDTVTMRDLFDTKLMNCLMPRPSEVVSTFWKKYEESPKAASDYFYKLSGDSDYIRRYRVRRDIKWKTDTQFGPLDISINLSKPEKDPRDIAAARNAKQQGYPKCLLCPENVGYKGRADHPARDNHRIIPLKLDGAKWGLQYSPYVYYNEHCIVFNTEHVPMQITEGTFRRLLDFVDLFPHYFLGSNADLPIVGGSILTHDHFQGGCYEFPMAKAEAEFKYELKDADGLEAEIVKWPMSVIRLRSKDKDRLSQEAGRILGLWREYTDEAAMIFAHTEGEAHNTITPIARMRGDKYELDLVLRNNLTTSEHPMGLYHPHAKLHHIKKENIGLIEVMGLAVLPARLKKEMRDIADLILKEAGNEDAAKKIQDGMLKSESLSKHEEWLGSWISDLLKFEVNEENVTSRLNEEVGKVFCEVLCDAGVYKCIEEGRNAFDRFLSYAGYKRK
ncbi:MAG: UDP-glucose--hexose-1-phosphate uridylyltransferase [Eubacteriales bacterium]|nr:UDP-glucose--hexose-1-phosphate uridylyltransferase [Eubacteriales bacterium]